MELPRGADGRRKRKFLHVRGTRVDAERKLRELLTALDHGILVNGSKMTLGQFLKIWVRDYVDTNTSVRTAQGYIERIKAYIEPHLGDLPLTKLTAHHVQSLHSWMLTKGLSARTVVGTHRVLRQALGHAIKWGILLHNPCDAVPPPKPQHREMNAMDTADVEKFLNIAAGSRYGPVYFLAIYTGLRRSELLGLRWSAVDLDVKSISITETLQYINGKGLTVLEPKTARSRRMVTLPPSAVALLSGLKVKQKDEITEFGLEWSESRYVFSQADGSPLYPNLVSRAFSQLMKEAEIPRVRFHDLRHTHATLMVKQGVNPKIVSERLGHASVTITLDTYSHVLPGLQEEAALRFEESLNGDLASRFNS